MKHLFKSPVTISPSNITKININGLRGRIVHYQALKKPASKKFVIISGHHTAHERMVSFADFLVDYGDVYMIDLPGFGGMDSFEKIGKPINLDSFAEYLYTVMKTQKLNKDITILSVSIGSEFVTHMFQKYPESQGWVTNVIGFVAFGAAKDFTIKTPVKLFYNLVAWTGSSRLGARLLGVVVFNRMALRLGFKILAKFKKKMKTDDIELREKFVEMEIFLWSINDFRTQALTTRMMFTKDLRKFSNEMISINFSNILSKDDQYTDFKEVNKTMRDLYSSYHPYYIDIGVHMPSMLADKYEVAKLFDMRLINEIIKTNDK